jgi:hypothetical protein
MLAVYYNVIVADGCVSLQQVLQYYYDLKNLKPELLQLLYKYSSDDSTSKQRLENLLKNGVRSMSLRSFVKLV